MTPRRPRGPRAEGSAHEAKDGEHTAAESWTAREGGGEVQGEEGSARRAEASTVGRQAAWTPVLAGVQLWWLRLRESPPLAVLSSPWKARSPAKRERLEQEGKGLSGGPAQKRGQLPKEQQSALPGRMESPPKLVVLDLQHTLPARWLAFQEPRSLLGTAFRVAWGQASVGWEGLCFQVNMEEPGREISQEGGKQGLRREGWAQEDSQRKGEAVRDSSDSSGFQRARRRDVRSWGQDMVQS